MSGSDLFVLVHSPLVGPLTWAPVAEALRQWGHDALVPVLRDTDDDDRPYWQQQVASVTQTLAAVPADRALVLVGHSGAGALLPAIGQTAGHRVAAYIFVDAGLPLDGMSRLDAMADSAPELAERLRAHLTAGGRFPTGGAENL